MALEALVGSILTELVALAAHSIKGSLGVAWGLKDELEKLQRLLARIQSVLADAEEKQIEDEAVKMWLHALKKAAYEAEDVVDQFNYEILRHKAIVAGTKNTVPGAGVKVRDFFSSHNQILVRVKMGRKLKNILSRIEDIESEGAKFNFAVSNVQYGTTPLLIRETSSFVVESDVVGRNEDREKMVMMLINSSSSHGSENLAVLAIVGMGGLGKTTMAQLIFNDPRVVDHFQLSVWVCVSDVWDMTKIMQDIISSIPGNKSELPTLELKQRFLREALMSKRFLIVLDDIWNEDRTEWDTLKGILDCGDTKGSAIIVTTRSERVAQITGTLRSYHLSCLSEDESWTLFCNKAFAPGMEKSEELVEIGKSIVQKCGGLPLAIKMLGSLLYMKTDLMSWLAIKDSSIWNMKTSILPALRLSYKHLPPYSKRCFTFCATFPKDFVIKKEVLIQMWMAHGYIPLCERLEVNGHEIFNQLVQRSFLHELNQGRQEQLPRFGCQQENCEPAFNVTTCSMHDLVHDLAKSIFGDECTTLSEGSLDFLAIKDTYHLFILDKLDIKQTIKAYPNLRTLIQSDHSMEAPTELSQFTFLRVLQSNQDRPSIRTKFLQHLRYLELSHTKMSELPESICTLFHLQTLNLSSSYQLRRLPESIYTLSNLRSLNLSGCVNLCELPERMHCMSGLRNLYLERCSGLRKMPVGMGRMTNLQTLTMYVVGDDIGRGIQELKGLHLSSRLDLYNLKYVKDAEEARQVNLHSKDLHLLTLCWREVESTLAFSGDDADSSLNEENGETVLEELKPPNSIRILKIWNYGGSKFPAWMTVGCARLVKLHLAYCTRLHRLPPLWRLNSLEVLIIRRMDNMKYIISDNDAADGDTTMQAFPSLHELSLHSLRCLEGWCENKNTVQAIMANLFPSLVRLVIDECPEMTDSMPLLSHLKELTLSQSKKIRMGCSFLPDETTPFRHLQCLEELSIAKCEEVAWAWCDQEEEMNGFGSCLKHMTITDCDWMFTSRHPGLWRCLTSLERLKISECQAPGNLFEMLQGLQLLRQLEISCSTRVPETTTSTMDACLPPQLELLEFSSCRSLRTLMLRCPASLKTLRISHCQNLISLTAAEQQLGQLTSLKVIQFWKCTSLNSLTLWMGGVIALDWLDIVACTAMTSLPECLLQLLRNLKQLSISGCPELEKKCSSCGEYWHHVSNIPKKRIGRKDREAQSSTEHFTAKFLNFLCHR